MSKRSMWVITCILFALFWVLVSSVLWILVVPVLMIPISLLMILVPVGVNDDFRPKHNPNLWHR